MYFIQQTTCVDSNGLAFFEAGLVHLGCDEMWALSLDLIQDGLLHDLGQVRSHHDGSDLIQSTGSLGKCLL